MNKLRLRLKQLINIVVPFIHCSQHPTLVSIQPPSFSSNRCFFHPTIVHSIHRSFHPTINCCIQSSFILSIVLSIQSSFFPSNRLSFHPTVVHSIQLSSIPSIILSIHPLFLPSSRHSFIQPSVIQSICQSFHLAFDLSMQLFFFPSNYYFHPSIVIPSIQYTIIFKRTL